MNPRQARGHQFCEWRDETTGFTRHQPHFDIDPRRTQLGDATSIDMCRRIDSGHHHTTNSRCNHRARTGRRLTKVTARFERHVQRGIAGRRTSRRESHHFRMRATESFVPAFTQHAAIVRDQDRANRRIRLNETDTAPREFDRATHSFDGSDNRRRHDQSRAVPNDQPRNSEKINETF